MMIAQNFGGDDRREANLFSREFSYIVCYHIVTNSKITGRVALVPFLFVVKVAGYEFKKM